MVVVDCAAFVGVASKTLVRNMTEVVIEDVLKGKLLLLLIRQYVALTV